MDPYVPINGISLERYAELSAEIDGITDPELQTQAIEALGVPRADWEAAFKGWQARMQDMSLMGAVATRFMPLYQAALTKKKGSIAVSYEDYVALAGAAKAMGIQAALGHYSIDMGAWTQIAGHWNGQIAANMMQFANHGLLVEQEGARIAQGGAPKPVTVTKGPPPAAAPAAPAPVPYATPAAYAPGSVPAQAGYGMAMPGTPGAQPLPGAQNPYANQQFGAGTYNQHAQHFDQNLGQAANAVAGAAASGFSAIGSAFNSAFNNIGMGSRVLVQWSDGNRYPGTVSAIGQGQYFVTMTDGRQVWIPTQYVSPAG